MIMKWEDMYVHTFSRDEWYKGNVITSRTKICGLKPTKVDGLFSTLDS